MRESRSRRGVDTRGFASVRTARALPLTLNSRKTFNLISSFTVISGDHGNYFFMIVNCVEEPKTADPVPPRLRFIIFKFFNIFPEIRVLLKLRVDVGSKF